MRRSRSRTFLPDPLSPLFCIAVLAAALAAGCGERPRVEKLDMARAQLAAAEVSPGVGFATAELDAARNALTAAEAEYKKQEGFGLKHSPDEGHRLADHTIELAKAASEHGDALWRKTSKEARKSLAKAEAEVFTLQAALTRMVRCHEKAPIKGARKLVLEAKEVKAEYKTASQQFDDGQLEQTIAASARLPEELERARRNIEHAINGSRCSDM